MLTPKSVNVLHMLLIGPFLAYIGLNGRKCSPLCFKVLAVLGIFVILYHGYSLYLGMNREISVSGLG